MYISSPPPTSSHISIYSNQPHRSDCSVCGIILMSMLWLLLLQCCFEWTCNGLWVDGRGGCAVFCLLLFHALIILLWIDAPCACARLHTHPPSWLTASFTRHLYSSRIITMNENRMARCSDVFLLRIKVPHEPEMYEWQNFFYTCVLFTLLTKSTSFFLLLPIEFFPSRCWQYELFCTLSCEQVAYSLSQCFCVDNFPIQQHQQQQQQKSVACFYIRIARILQSWFDLNNMRFCTSQHPSGTNISLHACHSNPRWKKKIFSKHWPKKEMIVLILDSGHTYQKPLEIIKWNSVVSFAIHFTTL